MLTDKKFDIELVRMHKLGPEGRIRAFFDFSIGDMFVIKGASIVEADKGMFISMPKETGRDGKYYFTCIPLTREVKEYIEKMALDYYNEQ